MFRSEISKLKCGFVIACLTSLLSCKETNPGPQPGITAISPQAGVASMEVTIEGVNFDPHPTGNKVKFNGIEATVISATSSELVVRVPDGVTSGAITIDTFFGSARSLTFRAYDVSVILNESSPDGKIRVAKLWRNGKISPISADNALSEGSRVLISGEDVHVVGYEFDGDVQPIYWKNGARTKLGNVGVASDVALLGTDVLVSGVEDNGGMLEAKYWKNLLPQSLAGTLTADEYANTIAVSGMDVYVGGGQADVNSVKQATYWRNGNPTTLGSGNTDNWLMDMVVKDGIVHAISIENYDPNNRVGVSYWVNGVRYILSDNTGYAMASSIAVSGSNVLVGGFKSYTGISVATIWVNGTAFPLSNGATNSLVSSVDVQGDDLFVAGFFFKPNAGLGFLLINEGVIYLTNGDTPVYTSGMFVRSL